MEIDNVTFSTVQTSDEQALIDESTTCIPTVVDESCPLLQRDQPTYEEAFTGFSSFCRHSCCQCCSCCSIT
jgi:hypothetical protein